MSTTTINNGLPLDYINFSTQHSQPRSPIRNGAPWTWSSSPTPIGRPYEVQLPSGVNDLSELSKNEQRRLEDEARNKGIEQVRRNLFPSKAWLAKRAKENENGKSLNSTDESWISTNESFNSTDESESDSEVNVIIAVKVNRPSKKPCDIQKQ